MKKSGNKRLKNENKTWLRRKSKHRSILDVRIKTISELNWSILCEETSMVQIWHLLTSSMEENQPIWSKHHWRKKFLYPKIQSLQPMSLKVKLRETTLWKNLRMRSQKHLNLKRIQLIASIWIKFVNLMVMRLFDPKVNICKICRLSQMKKKKMTQWKMPKRTKSKNSSKLQLNSSKIKKNLPEKQQRN